MKQSIKHSTIESILNVLLGIIISYISYTMLFPIFGMNIGSNNATWVTVYFTILSLTKTFALRRLFTNKTEESY